MQSVRKILVLASFLSLFTGCAVELDDTPADEEDKVHYEYGTWETHPNSSTYEYVECTTSGGSSRLCGYRPGTSASSTRPDYSWQSNCRGGDCQILNVFAHYSLHENLGTSRTLVIEAFENAQFSGSPAANIHIAGFDASRPNSSDLEEMYLAPGEYYFRAYFTTADSQPTPYPMDGMILVGEVPVGVYGALSGAKRVMVKPEQQPEVINIYINQLFKKPGSDPDTNARIRLRVNVSPEDIIPANRDVRIFLLKTPDTEARPLYNLSFSSNLLLVHGQEYTAEFVTPSLDLASYYVFAFVDENSNGYYDSIELGAFYLENQEVSSFPVERDRTRSLQLNLSLHPDR
ncbi:MAG TPA: hypothetical protein VE954_08370 [Oligoflexus sp.]|uniref:hypothetical protein n=1 Tax=Oligoflexus sp. TaxID=1971216 RepID=UPI002D6A0E73|nr:hypothetical protein [Oligoflexus sp.]HYX33118.1 hypothetical protein [Oligoflexus sp.]